MCESAASLPLYTKTCVEVRVVVGVDLVGISLLNPPAALSTIPNHPIHTESDPWECFILKHTNSNTTVGNGSLGSRVDEERSELRKVMRSATIVNH